MRPEVPNQAINSHRIGNSKVREQKGVIALFSPEHFYLFNTIAVPLLTGYLIEKGYPVIQRILDNEFYSYVAHPMTLRRSILYLKQHVSDLSEDHLAYLKETIKRGRLNEILNIETVDPRGILLEFLSCKKQVIKLLHAAERLLTNRFLNLSKDRFLLAMAHLQCAMDLFTASFWPSKFSLITGSSFPYAAERSESVYQAAGDFKSNFLLSYYRYEIVPSIADDTIIAGISLTHESQIIPAFTLAKEIKAQMPNIHIVMGGATLSSLRETFEKNNVLWEYLDSVVIGAGEEPLEKLYDELTSAECDLNRVPQLVWRNKYGQLERSSTLGTFTMDQVATPVFNDPRPRPIITLMTSVGCDWARCRFCHFPQIFSDDKSYQTRPIAHVMRDIEILTEKHNPVYFHICDTNLAVSHLGELADVILKGSLKPLFYSFVRAEKEFIDINFCKKVRRAGFFALHFGLESGSQRILNSMNKGINLDTIDEVIKNFFKADIMVNIFLIVGTPGEKQEDIEKSIRFVKDHLAYISGEVAVSRYYLDRHSYIYYHPEEFGLIIEHDPKADLDTDVNFRNPDGFNPEEMDLLVKNFYHSLGIPVSYGERYFFEMLERFCPNSQWQKMNLYSPFVLAKMKRQMSTIFIRKKSENT